MTGALHRSTIVTLSENSRPAWTLRPATHSRRQDIPTHFKPKYRYVLVPSLEHALEDGLLLTALVLLPEQPWGRATAELQRTLLDEGRIEIYSFSNDVCAQAREEVRQNSASLPKMVLTVFQFDALIHDQLGSLDRYAHAMSVCMPVFTRRFSPWGQTVVEEGALPVPDQPSRISSAR
jgi:hypothetical protein